MYCIVEPVLGLEESYSLPFEPSYESFQAKYKLEIAEKSWNRFPAACGPGTNFFMSQEGFLPFAHTLSDFVHVVAEFMV